MCIICVIAQMCRICVIDQMCRIWVIAQTCRLCHCSNAQSMCHFSNGQNTCHCSNMQNMSHCSNVHNMCHCSNPRAQNVKSQFYCTAELNILQRRKQLFSFQIPTPVSSHQLKHHITVVSKPQNIRQQHVIATEVLNRVINLKATTSEWSIRNLLFMCDVQTVAMITDRLATVKNLCNWYN